MKRFSKIFLIVSVVVLMIIQATMVFATEELEELIETEIITEEISENTESEERVETSEPTAFNLERDDEPVEETITTNLELSKDDNGLEEVVTGAMDYDSNISYLYNNYSGEEYTVTVVARGQYILEANIPEYLTVDGRKLKVTKVSGFYNCSDLTKVTLPTTLQEICNNAFSGCSSLTSINIPTGVISIGIDAFENSGITSIDIPQSVTYIGDRAFSGCQSLTTAKISGKIEYLNSEVFSGCTDLINVSLPNTITYSYYEAFKNCASLKSITLPDSLTNISNEMFYGCSSLTSIKLPDNLIEVGRSAFAYCSKLPTISFPYQVKTLSGYYYGYDGTFQGCDSLKSIYFTKSIQNIERHVFDGFNNCTIYGYAGSAAPTIAKEKGYKYVELTPVTSINISGNQKVVKGKTISLKATISPSNAFNKNLIWTSSNDTIATVDGTGKVTGKRSGVVTITAMAKDGTYIQGTYRVTVSLTDMPFDDVNVNNWYYEAVNYCYKNNIISGTKATTFSPATKLTRGMLVTILYKMEGQPKVTGTSKFPDVQSNKQYYYNAVVWASSKGVVSGYNNGKFGPNDNITREDLAVILNRYAKYKGKKVNQTSDLKGFTDTNKISSYAKSQMQWAVGAGVITGNANKTLDPKGKSTRAEAAAMIHKYCQKIGR